jgi:lipopolysaccharide transport system permease protein
MIVLRLFKPLWSYRGFIFGSVKREFQQRYRNSMLGAAWLVIQPATMIFVYTVIFGQVMKAKLPGVESGFAYSIYICSGILTWALFSEITTRGVNVFLENANLLKKLNFPRLCSPVVVVLNSLLNFSVIFSIFLLFLIVTGHFPGLVLLAIIPLILVQILFSIGLGVTLGVLNVFFRDVGQAFGVILQFWFWLTPIVYPTQILPEKIRDWLFLNPMATLIGGYQSIFVFQRWPNFESLAYVVAVSLLICLLGLRLFRKRAGEMVDEL